MDRVHRENDVHVDKSSFLFSCLSFLLELKIAICFRNTVWHLDFTNLCMSWWCRGVVVKHADSQRRGCQLESSLCHF